MPSHRAAGSTLDADTAPAEAVLAPVEEWEGRLRSRAAWVTAPVQSVPAQGSALRRSAPAQVTAFVPSTGPVPAQAPAPAAETSAPAVRTPAAQPPAAARPVVAPPVPAQASVRSGPRHQTGPLPTLPGQSFGVQESSSWAPAAAPRLPEPRLEVAAGALSAGSGDALGTALRAPEPRSRSGRRRSDRPVDARTAEAGSGLGPSRRTQRPRDGAVHPVAAPVLLPEVDAAVPAATATVHAPAASEAAPLPTRRALREAADPQSAWAAQVAEHEAILAMLEQAMENPPTRGSRSPALDLVALPQCDPAPAAPALDRQPEPLPAWREPESAAPSWYEAEQTQAWQQPLVAPVVEPAPAPVVEPALEVAPEPVPEVAPEPLWGGSGSWNAPEPRTEVHPWTGGLTDAVLAPEPAARAWVETPPWAGPEVSPEDTLAWDAALGLADPADDVPVPTARPADGATAVHPPVPQAVEDVEDDLVGADDWVPALDPADIPGPSAFVPDRGRQAHRLHTRARSVLPQVGVVGVLGLATLVAPMVGDLVPAFGSDASHVSRTDSALSASPASAAASAVQGAASRSSAKSAQGLVTTRAAQEMVSRGSDRAASTAAQVAAQAKATAAAAAAAQAAAAKAAADAAAREKAAVEALVPGCSGTIPDVTGEKNGRLPEDQLCGLSWQSGHRLRSDAAVAFAKLDLAYKAQFGEDIQLTDSYRSYAAQVKVRRSKPGLAAVPGTSEHGWGLAVDMGGGVQNADEHYDWLIANAPKFGWDHPAWARKGGAGPYEPWHWEYVAGEA